METKAETAVLFSGGRDSSLVVCLLGQQRRKQHLVSCFAGDTVGRSMQKYRYGELRRAFPDSIQAYAIIPCYGLFRRIALSNLESDFKKYGVNLISIGSQITYNAEGILYCLRNGIKTLAVGYRRGQFDCMEQMPEAVDLLANFANELGIDYETPVYSYENDRDVKSALLDFGITTKALEGAYLFGDESSHPSNDAVLRYISDKLAICRGYIQRKTFPSSEILPHKTKSVCICGSFKFYEDMEKIREELTRQDILCFTPEPCKLRDRNNITNDPHRTVDEARNCVSKHLRKIDAADLVYVYDRNGYVGNSVTMEIGYAVSRGKQVVALEPIEDLSLMSLISKTVNPDDLIRLLKGE